MSNIFKEFKLSSASVNNRTSVYVLTVLIFIIGLMAYKSMPKESFPEIKQPTIYVNTIYPGNSPIDIENLVTRPLEKEINTINGIKALKSTSVQDVSVIIAEFELDVNPTEALNDIKEAVDRAKSELPGDLPQDPSVMELDFSEFPVMNINLAGDYPYQRLKQYAEYLEDEIENLPEISGVDISGLQEDEVEISVDKIKMEALEISFRDIEGAIAGENISMSGGDIQTIEGTDINRRSLRVDGEFKSMEDLENIIVKNEFQNIVYLKDIAKVNFGPKEPVSFARLDSKPVLALDIKKKSGENLLNAADKIKVIIENAKKSEFPKDLSVVITNDQSKFTVSMVSNLENSIIMGVLLVVFVLLFFLGLRNSLFVGIAIPLSMLMGIAILNFGGNTLNMMVLFSLILALGMLVDNGIVVVENIYRMRTEGMDNTSASKYGVAEVAWPIISSTATTVAAFLPLLFWKDLIGEFMKFLPITLIIVLSASLFVALVVNPVLTADYLTTEIKPKSPAKKFWTRNGIMLVLALLFIFTGISKMLGGLFISGIIFNMLYRWWLKPGSEKFMNVTMPKIENFYYRSIQFALRGKNPILFFVGTIVLMIFSLIFFGASKPKVLFFPDNEPKMVNIFIDAPLGTDISKTNEIAKELESKVWNTIKKDSIIVEAMLAQVGEKTADPNEGPQTGSSPHKARITVSFLEYEKRQALTDRKTSEIMADIKEVLRDYPAANITISKDKGGPPVGKPINVEVKGKDYLELIAYVEQLKQLMEDANIPGVDKLKTDLELGKPMLEVTVDREAARRFGLSTQQIAYEIRGGLLGREISKFKEEEDDYKIQLRFSNEYRYNLNNLLNTKITFRNPANGRISQVPITAVTKIDYNSTYGSVKRQDMDRVITIFSEVESGYNANEIVAQYKQILAGAPTKAGYEFKFTGEQEQQSQSTDFMVRALWIAIGIIFLIIVSQFNSIIGPVIIMFSILFSTIGVFLGFAIFKMPFVILMCGIGIISLAGVVVNNAIVLIDYTNLLGSRKRQEMGIPEDGRLPDEEILHTIMEAGKTRLRPVLLTAITTVLGLVPLALGMNINFFTLLTDFNPDFYMGGDNADFWGPMAWTVIFGLTFATFLTLIIVPVMYWLADVMMYRIKKFLNKL
jgi:multidrug efflux pump subunit AcrB